MRRRFIFHGQDDKSMFNPSKNKLSVGLEETRDSYQQKCPCTPPRAFDALYGHRIRSRGSTRKSIGIGHTSSDMAVQLKRPPYESNNSRNDYKRQSIHVRFTALAVKTILFVENDGPNRHSSGLSSSGGFMEDIPNCKSSELGVAFKTTHCGQFQSWNYACWCLLLACHH